MPLMFVNKQRARQDLLARVSGQRGLANFKLLKVIKVRPAKIMATGTLFGRKVMLKCFLQSGAADLVREARKELDTVSFAMGTGPHLINACLGAFPDLGVLVLEFVPGQRLNTVISAADRAERARLLTQSGAWLKAYIAGRSELVPQFSPQWWIKTVAPVRRDLSGDDLALFEDVMSALRLRAKQVRGMTVTKAATHGDFVSINAHYHEGTIYGLDVQGLAYMPVARDVARFLVWTQAQTPPPTAPSEWVCGIAKADVTAILASDILPDLEKAELLPFFIGKQIAARMGDFQNDSAAMARLHVMAAQFVAETSAL